MMQMFICLGCGHIFDNDEVLTWQEDRGEYWGAPCSESISGCPQCKSDYVTAHRCAYCDEWIDGEYIKLENGERICEHCYTTYDLGDED